MTKLIRRIIECLMRYYIRNWRGDKICGAVSKTCPVCQARNAYDTITEFSFVRDNDGNTKA